MMEMQKTLICTDLCTLRTTGAGDGSINKVTNLQNIKKMNIVKKKTFN